jgi:hypothetical protein
MVMIICPVPKVFGSARDETLAIGRGKTEVDEYLHGHFLGHDIQGKNKADNSFFMDGVP